MKVFLSWSGERSESVAAALREWLPSLLETLDPWMSRSDLDAGTRWGRDIEAQLTESSFGVICVTPENAENPWINFEAGAIAKEVSETRVVPYCIGFPPVELPAGPLTLFQGVQADESGTWELLKSIDKSRKDKAVGDTRLRKMFDRAWPELDRALSELPEPPQNVTNTRSTQDYLEEILETVRGLSRRGSASGRSAVDPILTALEGSPERKGPIWHAFMDSYHKAVRPDIDANFSAALRALSESGAKQEAKGKAEPRNSPSEGVSLSKPQSAEDLEDQEGSRREQ